MWLLLRNSRWLQIVKQWGILFFPGKSRIEKGVKAIISGIIIILGITAITEPVHFTIALSGRLILDKQLALGLVAIAILLIAYGLFVLGRATEIASGPLRIGDPEWDEAARFCRIEVARSGTARLVTATAERLVDKNQLPIPNIHTPFELEWMNHAGKSEVKLGRKKLDVYLVSRPTERAFVSLRGVQLREHFFIEDEVPVYLEILFTNEAGKVLAVKWICIEKAAGRDIYKACFAKPLGVV